MIRWLLMFIISICVIIPALATYKPEYDKVPTPVRKWFESQYIPGTDEYWMCEQKINNMLSRKKQNRAKLECALRNAPAYLRLQVFGCCKNADRLKTKFIPSEDGDWAYYPDPKCTHSGCKLLLIPHDVYESTPIEPEPVWLIGLNEEELAKVAHIFKQIRQEGVLFIHDGRPVCFWPPQTGG